MKKKVDNRIKTLIENGVKTRHRSFFIIVGDKSRDQIVNRHYMMSKAVIKSRPTVIWCYKDKLELRMGLDGSEDKAVVLPGAALCKQLFAGMVGNGDGKMGTQGFVTVLERINGISE